jgi:hypothetical protein
MRKLRRLIYLLLLGTLGTLALVLFPEYTLLVIFGASTLLLIAQQLNFYKIILMLKRLVQNTRRLYFENQLRLLTGFRGDRDGELERAGRMCL